MSSSDIHKRSQQNNKTSDESYIFEGLSRELFDGSDEISYERMTAPGLTEEVVRQISSHNNEPEWMLDLRLKSLAAFRSMALPEW